MTKAELIELRAEATGLSKAQAGEFINRLGDIVVTELLAGGEVPIPQVGKLHIKETAARMGRNPKTGAKLDIPAGKKVYLTVKKALKESLK